jgi:hypothetical protein
MVGLDSSEYRSRAFWQAGFGVECISSIVELFSER